METSVELKAAADGLTGKDFHNQRFCFQLKANPERQNLPIVTGWLRV